MLLSHLVLLCCRVAAEGMSPSEMGPGKQGLQQVYQNALLLQILLYGAAYTHSLFQISFYNLVCKLLKLKLLDSPILRPSFIKFNMYSVFLSL